MSESKPAKPWWAGSQDVEPFMPPVATAISRHIERIDPAWTDIYNRAYEAVYTALQSRAQPSNEPLALEELREMYDEPVWVVCGIYKDWRIPEFIDEGGYKGFIKFTDRSAEPISDYGKNWVAYSHKPGGEHNA